MTRRRFAFWLGMGLFGAAERLNAQGLDTLAAVLMDATGDNKLPKPPQAATVSSTSQMPVHWQTTHNATWRWAQREHFVAGEWVVTGMTVPVRRDTGEPLADAAGYLDDNEAPAQFLANRLTFPDEFGDPISVVDDGISIHEDAPGPDAASHRQARHGRPPSRWLRSLNADELSLWLATITPPEAGVDGMTFAEHLTRDHGFDATPIEGLTEAEQDKLHAAAHHGY